MRNGFYVIDAHCHTYPEKIAARAVKGTDDFYSLNAKCTGTPNDLIKEDIEAGIDFALIQSVATTPKQVRSINEFIAFEVQKHPDRFKGLGTVHHESEDMEGDVRHIIELGLVGIKIHPDIQRVKIDDYRLLKVYEMCEKYGLPVLLHTGDDRYDYSNPNRLRPILEIYKDLKVIGAHFGGYSVWDEAVRSFEGKPNFYIDISSSIMYLGKEKAVEYIRRYGIDHVMFGTDHPLWKPKEELDVFFELDLDDRERKLILSENAKKLFKL